MLDIWRYGDRTLWAPLEPFIIQLGKYTHTHTHTGVVSMKKVMLAEGKPFIYNNNFPLWQCTSGTAVLVLQHIFASLWLWRWILLLFKLIMVLIYWDQNYFETKCQVEVVGGAPTKGNKTVMKNKGGAHWILLCLGHPCVGLLFWNWLAVLQPNFQHSSFGWLHFQDQIENNIPQIIL